MNLLNTYKIDHLCKAGALTKSKNCISGLQVFYYAFIIFTPKHFDGLWCELKLLKC